jgi:hypothetical protein
MRKINLKIVILISLIFLIKLGFTQSFTVEGYAFLELQNDHSGILVRFERFAPSFLADSAFTDETGHYAIPLEQGIYKVFFSKLGYIEIIDIEIPVYSSTIIEDQTLELLGLSGNLAGTIASGFYKVGGNITVLEDEELILEPGTIFMFKDDLEFEIYGKLSAIGEKEDSIKFTRFNIDGNWKGIDFKEGSSSESILKYCIVEFSNDRGISVFKCDPRIENSLIHYNSHISSTGGQSEEDGGGAGICLKYSNTEIKYVKVSDNGGVTLGCGIYCNDGNPKISNSLIVNNVNPNLQNIRPGGGINCSYSTNLIIENSIISGNANGIGGGICINGDGSYIPNVIIVNSIITDNICLEYGGGCCAFNGFNLSIQNSLFWDNQGGNFYCDDQWLGINVTTNNNLDSCDAYGNISFDPLFVSIDQDDFRLTENSPCIDAGVNEMVSSSIDFDHNYRIWDGNNDNESIVDMGAFEFGSETNTFGVNFSKLDSESNILVFPNPTDNCFNVDADEISNIEIYDLTGLLIIESHDKYIDISGLQSGYYILKVYQKNNKINHCIKLIKK